MQAFLHKDYALIRNDPIAGGGGVMAYVKKSYSPSSVVVHAEHETISFKLQLKSFQKRSSALTIHQEPIKTRF